MLFRRFIRLALFVGAMVALSVGLVTSATAATEHRSTAVDVRGGTTTVTVAPGTVKVLTDNGVRVTPIPNAVGLGGTFLFPVVGGRIDPTTLAGTIVHSGGLQFAAGGKRLGVQDFIIDTTKSVLTARVSGTSTRIPLLHLDLGNVRVIKGGTVIVISNVHASLTGEAAAALNATFHVSLFEDGLTIGVARSIVITQTARRS